jgi:hypothetical protein
MTDQPQQGQTGSSKSLPVEPLSAYVRRTDGRPEVSWDTIAERIERWQKAHDERIAGLLGLARMREETS